MRTIDRGITTGTLTITTQPDGVTLYNSGVEVGRFVSVEGAQARARRTFGEDARVVTDGMVRPPLHVKPYDGPVVASIHAALCDFCEARAAYRLDTIHPAGDSTSDYACAEHTPGPVLAR